MSQGENFLRTILLEMETVVYLKKKLAKEKVPEPMIGLEYLINLYDKSVDPFFCALCERKGVLPNVVAHFLSCRHRLAFIKKHLPSVYDVLNTNEKLKGKEDGSVFQNLLRRLAMEIENHYPRQMPYVTTTEKYRRTKDRIFSAMNHAREVPSSTLVIDLIMLIQKYSRRQHSSDRETDKRSARSRSVSRSRRRSRSRSYRRHRTSSRRHRSRRDRSRSRSARRRSSRSRNRIPKFRPKTPETPPALKKEEEVVEKYGKEYEKITQKIKRQYQKYVKKPESHPNYASEWASFWICRCAQLKSQSPYLDIDNYNFVPEWTAFFQYRLENLEKQELFETSIALRIKFRLPLEKKKPEPEKESEPIKHETVSPAAPEKKDIEAITATAEMPEAVQKQEVTSAAAEVVPAVVTAPVSVIVANNVNEAKEELSLDSKDVPEGYPTFDDLVYLYTNFNKLEKQTKKNAISYVNHLKILDPALLEKIISSVYPNSIEENEAMKKLPEAESEDDDDASLEKVIKAVNEKLPAFDGTIKVPDDDEDDDDQVEIVDLTLSPAAE